MKKKFDQKLLNIIPLLTYSYFFLVKCLNILYDTDLVYRNLVYKNVIMKLGLFDKFLFSRIKLIN